MFTAIDELRCGDDLRMYAEGWQSWSETGWMREASVQPLDDAEYKMRFRPDKPLPDSGIQAEGLLVVDPGNGDPVIRYTVPDPCQEVASIRAVRHGDHVVVSADGPVVRTSAATAQEALESYPDLLGPIHIPEPLNVWCSWYRYFEDLTAKDVLENLDSIAREDLNVDVVQIDDGWTLGLGHYAVVSPEFGPLDATIDRIRAAGRRAGIWLAPFLVGRDTPVAHDHPDWLTSAAGRNWGTDLVGLDLTHPGVQEFLAGLINRLVAHGVSYLKLDFLYGGAVPGQRYDGSQPVAAYRRGLELIRETAGDETFLVGCGAPLLPSVGLVDAMRVSRDTFHEDARSGETGLRGGPAVRSRSWQHGRLWINDPDCIVMRPGYPLRHEWADIATRHGGMRSFSDRIGELDQIGLDRVRAYLAHRPTTMPFTGPEGTLP
ncbi:glycoside hydrolase family 36 protein [Luteococcus sp. H138]|uniref:glycoside hydrolase family 36 protein n=1 Tax=unclassified Luteococcus TaxID=2639923 RepID=UPI00313D2C6B